MPLLGAHMSIAGGLHLAFERLRQVDGKALQIFTRNQRQWLAPPLEDSEVTRFLAAWQQTGRIPVAAHASYLINLATPDKAAASRATAAFAVELQRAGELKIPWLIIHPGSHLGSGIGSGISRIAANLDRAFEKAGQAGDEVTVLLETTAGQGSGVGSRFEELGSIIEHSRYPARLGVCFDTCHVFAAGYDMRAKETYDATMTSFDRQIGLKRLQFLHLNDSKQALGSRVDRHAHIGQGHLGFEAFRHLMHDPRFANHPMTLETPKGKDLAEDRANLLRLRSL